MKKTRSGPPHKSADIELPEGWASPSLGQLFEPSKERVEPGNRPDAPYLSLEHIEAGTGRILTHGQASEVVSTKAVFRAGDVLYGKLRPYLNKVCTPDFDGICSTDILVFPKSAFVESRYLLRFLTLPGVVAFATQNMSGVQLPRISFRKLAELPVPLPPLAEQIRIVAKVEALLERASTARGRLAKIPAVLRRFHQSILASACSGQLTAAWREMREPSEGSAAPRCNLRNRGASDPSNAPNTDQIQGDLPEGWQWWTVEDLAEAVIDYRGRTPPSLDAGPIPHLRTTNIRNGQIDWKTDRYVTEAVYQKHMTRGLPTFGDVLFTMEAPLGEAGVVDRAARFSIAQRILLLRAKRELALGHYLALALQSLAVRRAIEGRATGSTVLGIAFKRLRFVLIPVPSLDEQHEIVRRVNALFSLAASVDREVLDAKAKVELLPHPILTRSFRGELVPTEADLARKEGREYEPASVLLTRMEAARNEHKPTKRARGGKTVTRQRPRVEAITNGLPLDEILGQQGKRLRPERLFDLAGFDEDLVDRFYEQLRQLVQNGSIREDRPNKRDVFLKAVGHEAR